MKLHSLSQAPTRQQAMFFRNGQVGLAIVLVVLLSVCGMVIYKYSTGKMPLGMMLFVIFVLSIFILFCLAILRRSFQPTNWLMALGPGGFWIKYRSYLNSHLPPDDLQIVELGYAEVASVGLVRRTEIVPNIKSGTRVQYLKYLEFSLHQPFEDDLPQALKAECLAKDRPERKVRSKTHDYPVSVMSDRVFRVRVGGMRPGWKTALGELERNGITIAPAKREKEDFTRPLADKRQMEDRIVRLVEAGRTFEAVKLARRHYGMGLTEARQFIDDLTNPLPQQGQGA